MNNIIILFISMVAGVLTFEMSKIKHIGIFRASAGLTLLFQLDLILFSNWFEFNSDLYSTVFFGGTFVGMCSFEKFILKHVLAASMLYALIFVLLTPYLQGMGGALGFSAFISVILIKGLFYLFEMPIKRA